MKIKRIEAQAISEVFGKVVSGLSGETWLAVAKGLKDLGAINATTEDLKKELVAKYGKKDENGELVSIDVKNEAGETVGKQPQFEDEAKANKDFQLLLNEEVDIEFKKVKFKNWQEFPAEYKDIQLWLLDRMIEEK